jgi:hypothetical protein
MAPQQRSLSSRSKSLDELVYGQTQAINNAKWFFDSDPAAMLSTRSHPLRRKDSGKAGAALAGVALTSALR